MAAREKYELKPAYYTSVLAAVGNAKLDLKEQLPSAAWSYREEFILFAVGRWLVNPPVTGTQLRAWLKENKPQPKPTAAEVKPGQLTFLDPSEVGQTGNPMTKPDEIKHWIQDLRAHKERAARAGPWGSYAEAKGYQSAFARVMKALGKTRKEYRTHVITVEGTGHYLDFWIGSV